MALPLFPTAVAAFLAALNGNAFDASSNPEGLAEGGHRQLFPEAMNSTAEIANYFAALGVELLALADAVAEDAASAAAGSGTEASISDIRAGGSAQYLSIRRVLEANVPVALTDGANIAWDMDTGINFKVVLGAAGRTMANPSNLAAGKSGVLRVLQDATGGRSITGWGSAFIWIGGQPAWPTAPNARSLIAYFVGDDGKVELTFGGSSA